MKILIIGLSLSCYNWWSIKDIKFYEIWITNSSKVTIPRFINQKKDITNSEHCQETMNKYFLHFEYFRISFFYDNKQEREEKHASVIIGAETT